MVWRKALGAVALVVTSCSGGPEAAGRPLRDFRGIIHCHSLYSHDSKGTYEEILAAAKAAKVDFVIMTDHPPRGDPGRPLREGWRGLREGVLFIQGAELAGSNLLALGIREPVRDVTVPEKISAIHAQGGLAFVSHPEEVKDWALYETADGMEIYNLHAAFKRKVKDPTFLARALKLLKEDPDHTFTLLQELEPAVLARWDGMNRRRRFVGIAGNDAHRNVNLLGIQLDPYERSFRFVSTHVWAEELSEARVLSSLRDGKSYVAFNGRRAPADFGLQVHRAGTLIAPHPCDHLAHWVRVYRDGVLIETRTEGPDSVVAFPGDGTYRVVYGAEAPLLVSNPVRMGSAVPGE